jgi:hypothetical protein
MKLFRETLTCIFIDLLGTRVGGEKQGYEITAFAGMTKVVVLMTMQKAFRLLV